MFDVSALKEQYDEDGFVLVESLFEASEIQKLQQATEELIEISRKHQVSDQSFDLECDHTESSPRVQRIKVPHQQHESFAELVRDPKLLEILRVLIGEDVRFRNSKLNIKAAKGGAAVDWHQDWAFYPHTNDDVLTVAILLDDMDADNGSLGIVAGSHKGPVFDHHADGATVAFSPSGCLKQGAEAVSHAKQPNEKLNRWQRGNDITSAKSSRILRKKVAAH